MIYSFSFELSVSSLLIAHRNVSTLFKLFFSDKLYGLSRPDI